MAKKLAKRVAKIAEGVGKLYAGTRPATLKRYGETDDKTEELI